MSKRMKRLLPLAFAVVLTAAGGIAAATGDSSDVRRKPPTFENLPELVPFLDSDGEVVGHIKKGCLFASPNARVPGCPDPKDEIGEGLEPESVRETSVTADGEATERTTTSSGQVIVRKFHVDFSEEDSR